MQFPFLKKGEKVHVATEKIARRKLKIKFDVNFSLQNFCSEKNSFPQDLGGTTRKLTEKCELSDSIPKQNRRDKFKLKF